MPAASENVNLKFSIMQKNKMGAVITTGYVLFLFLFILLIVFFRLDETDGLSWL